MVLFVYFCIFKSSFAPHPLLSPVRWVVLFSSSGLVGEPQRIKEQENMPTVMWPGRAGHRTQDFWIECHLLHYILNIQSKKGGLFLVPPHPLSSLIFCFMWWGLSPGLHGLKFGAEQGPLCVISLEIAIRPSETIKCHSKSRKLGGERAREALLFYSLPAFIKNIFTM